MFNLVLALQGKNCGDIESERGQIDFVALFFPLDQLTVSQDGDLILQFLRRKMECSEELFDSGFASGFDELANRLLQFSQTFCCFKPRRLSELRG